MDIEHSVKVGKKVIFTNLRKSNLWYIVGCGSESPVSIEDVGDGMPYKEEKAMLFTRHTSNHLEIKESK